VCRLVRDKDTEKNTNPAEVGVRGSWAIQQEFEAETNGGCK